MNHASQAPAAVRSHGYRFNAVRQFTVRPDRRCQVDLKENCLSFLQVGNQFDREWYVRGLERVVSVAPRFVGSGLKRLMGASRTTLLVTGIAVTLVSGLLLIFIVSRWASLMAEGSALAPKFTYQLFTVAPLLVLLLVTGLATTLLGFLGRTVGNGTAAGPHDFRLPLNQIRAASFAKGQGSASDRMRAGGPRVALLTLQPMTGKPIKLAIPEPGDLEVVESHLLPRLGSRVTRE